MFCRLKLLTLNYVVIFLSFLMIAIVLLLVFSRLVCLRTNGTTSAAKTNCHVIESLSLFSLSFAYEVTCTFSFSCWSHFIGEKSFLVTFIPLIVIIVHFISFFYYPCRSFSFCPIVFVLYCRYVLFLLRCRLFRSLSFLSLVFLGFFYCF